MHLRVSPIEETGKKINCQTNMITYNFFLVLVGNQVSLSTKGDMDVYEEGHKMENGRHLQSDFDIP